MASRSVLREPGEPPIRSHIYAEDVDYHVNEAYNDPLEPHQVFDEECLTLVDSRLAGANTAALTCVLDLLTTLETWEVDPTDDNRFNGDDARCEEDLYDLLRELTGSLRPMWEKFNPRPAPQHAREGGTQINSAIDDFRAAVRQASSRIADFTPAPAAPRPAGYYQPNTRTGLTEWREVRGITDWSWTTTAPITSEQGDTEVGVQNWSYELADSADATAQVAAEREWDD